MECVRDFTTIISNMFICAGVLIAMLQLKNFVVDNEQQKKQATIEFYQSIRNEFVDLLRKIEITFPNDKTIRANDVKNNEKLLFAIREYLCYMEKFSVGVNGNIYDFATFEAMSGISAMGWFDKLEEVIKYLRRDNSVVFKNFERLVIKLKKTKSQNKEVKKRSSL